MLTLVPVTAETDNLPKIEALYRRAFPKNERRPFRGLFGDPQGVAEMMALQDGPRFCGFVCLLNGRELSHIIYFAVEEGLRGQGYGAQTLAALHAARPGRRIIVDIELERADAPNNDQRRRRKQFYLRQGYQPTDIRYRWQGEDYEILSHGGPVSEAEFDAFWEEM